MPALQPSRVHVGSSGHFWSTYQCIAEEAHSPDDAKTSEYWSHVASARQLRVHDVFEVRSEDGQWAVDLTVSAIGNKSCRVRVLREWTADDYGADAAEESPVDGVIVVWKGPALKWCIIRGSDKAMIKDGLPSKKDATREAIEYEKLVAA
jgi:hypothetical protein